MFTQSKTSQELDVEISRVFSDLKSQEIDSEKYEKRLDRLSALYKLKDSEKNPTRISPDTVIVAATNLLGIVMILKHEYAGNFISSKATSFVPKPR